MHDLSQEPWRRKQDLQDRLVELIGSYGYRYLDTPILEPTELFLRKAGGELASRMYSFTDAGSNSVSLRPEFTSPIMRHYLEHAGDIGLPARWQYAGPVFRYEEGGESNGQFTQVGAELLGSSSVMADVELLGLAAQVPSQLGLSGYQVEVADLDVVHSVLDAVGVSERARTFIIGSVPLLREGRRAVPSALERARQLHLANQDAADDYLSQSIKGLDDHQSRKVLQGLLQWSAAGQLGQREPDEVVDRLLRKLRGGDDDNILRRALELISDLAGIRGEPGPSVAAARAVVRKAGAAPSAVDRFEEFLGLVQAEPSMVHALVVDLGHVRGLAYYNGLVFEVTHPECPSSLGGGGRYDGLARALGSPEPLPALGFAFNLEAMLALTGGLEADEDRASAALGAFVLAEDPESYGYALKATQELRRQGIPAELDVCGQGLAQGLAYARGKGMTQVVVVNQDGQQTSHKVE
jgi:histidyl-tRNA synthetase